MPWVWTLNWSEIRSDIVIGSCPMTMDDIACIREQTGVTALLSIQSDECRTAFDIDYEAHQRYAKRLGLVMANAPMRDFDPPEQRTRLPYAVATLCRLLAGGHRVYVHCTAGLNRSPLTVLAYLSFTEGMTTEEAMALIHRHRPEAAPTWEAYHGCLCDLVEQNRNAIAHRAWELSQKNPENAEINWHQAKSAVIRDVFVATLDAPHRL